MSAAARRALDLTIALCGLALSAPLLPLIAVAIKADSRGPVLYRAPRVGVGGVPFTMFKFRTMAVGERGPRVTAGGDRRITRVGRILRRTKLDELPQLVNVLKGDMAIVGPRPEDPALTHHYVGELARVFDARPGITSPASVAFRDEEAILAQSDRPVEEAYHEVVARKARIDLEFLDHRTVVADLRVVVDTVLAIGGRR